MRNVSRKTPAGLEMKEVKEKTLMEISAKKGISSMKKTTKASVCHPGRCLSLFVVAIALLTGSPARGQASANLYAVVDMFGTLVSGNGVAGVTYIGSGQYEVTFTSTVSGCAYVATTNNAYTQAIQAYTAGGHLSATQGVYVETKNQGGGLTNGPFNLFVDCGTPGTSYAVVGYAANLVRSTPGTTLTTLGPGRYEVNFPGSVEACAFLATVGDPANALVFAPSGVYTGSGSAPNKVYIETKNPGGGLQPAVPFHLAVVCPNAPGTRVVVVRAGGFAQRGSLLTSSFDDPITAGDFTLVTNRDISACGTVATRGSVDTAVPFNPATVEVISGPAINTIGIEMRQLLFSGGAVFSDAFHAAVVCADVQ
jgi:hypothetical protein